MKKIICLLLLPLFSLIFLCGCGEDKTSFDLAVLYESMVENTYVVEKDNKFFSDSDKKNSIAIKYTDEVQKAINYSYAETDNQKRYTAIKYQQLILDYIFNYYENNQENFYTVMSSAEFSNNDMNNLYSSLENLKNTLSKFKISYDAFIDATNDGVSDVMEFNLTNYSFELNKVIDASFDFMYKFANMYETYGIQDYSALNATNLQIKVDKSYLDIAKIIYLENFKAFDYSVGSKGVCDLLPTVDVFTSHTQIQNLTGVKKLSGMVSENLNENSEKYSEIIDNVNNYLYSKEVFDQRVDKYGEIYNELDIYSITQYKFRLAGISYDDYKNTLDPSEQASLNLLDNFISNYYYKLLNTLLLIVE